MVHGIGSELEVQRKNEADFLQSINKVIKGGFFESDYQVISHIVDWKTIIEESYIRKRM